RSDRPRRRARFPALPQPEHRPSRAGQSLPAGVCRVQPDGRWVLNTRPYPACLLIAADVAAITAQLGSVVATPTALVIAKAGLRLQLPQQMQYRRVLDPFDDRLGLATGRHAA